MEADEDKQKKKKKLTTTVDACQVVVHEYD